MVILVDGMMLIGEDVVIDWFGYGMVVIVVIQEKVFDVDIVFICVFYDVLKVSVCMLVVGIEYSFE